MSESVLKTGAKTEFKEGIMFTVVLLLGQWEIRIFCWELPIYKKY